MTAKAFDRLLGNDLPKQLFLIAIEQGTLAHAYLLEGGRGSGRHTLVTAVAEALAGNDPQAFKIGLGLCPDILTVRLPDEKKTIGVDTIREVKEKAMLRPNDLSFKVFIIENADCMTVQAQNAALKLFEEPPRDVYFFLLCENSRSLLPTVRSRMQVLRMERFGKETLCRILAGQMGGNTADDRIADAVLRCDGWLGQALEILRGQGQSGNDPADKTEEAVIQLLEKLSQKDFPAVLSAIISLPGGRDREKMIQNLSKMQAALRDILFARLNGNRTGTEAALFFFPSETAARGCAKMLPNRSLLLLYDRLEQAKKDLQSNANLSLQKNLLATDLLYAAAGKTRKLG